MINVTPKQQKFADEYLKDTNGTRAYKAAYPSVKRDEAAAANAARLLRNAKVSAYIRAELSKMHDKRTADAKEVIEYLTSVMRGEQKEKVLRGQGMGEQEITDMDVSAKDRIKAAELIGKRYGIWTDNVNLTNQDVVIKIGGDTDAADD